MYILAQNQNAFDHFPEWHKHHPVVPEPSTYGVIFIALTILLVLIFRKVKR